MGESGARHINSASNVRVLTFRSRTAVARLVRVWGLDEGAKIWPADAAPARTIGRWSITFTSGEVKMVLLPKLRDHIMASAAQAFHARHRTFSSMTASKLTDTQFAWAAVATRPIAAREVIEHQAAARRIKIPHARVLFGFACLLLLLALLLSQPVAATGTTPYLTYDKISSLQAAPLSADLSPSTAAPCSTLTTALDLCEP